MDRFTYQNLRTQRPELDLPEWHRLKRTDRHRAKRLSREQIVAYRVRVILLRAGTGNGDAVQPIQAKNILKAYMYCPDMKYRVLNT